jgi:hypothetical protein
MSVNEKDLKSQNYESQNSLMVSLTHEFTDLNFKLNSLRQEYEAKIKQLNQVNQLTDKNIQQFDKFSS